MSIHYAGYADKAHQVEHIGRRRRNDCIKTIPVEEGHVSMLSFSPDGTQILSDSFRDIYVWDATSGKRIAGPLVAEEGDEDDEDEEEEDDDLHSLRDFIAPDSDEDEDEEEWEMDWSNTMRESRRASGPSAKRPRKSLVQTVNNPSRASPEVIELSSD